MVTSAHLRLPDGRLLEYQIRSSARTRNLCLKITMEGLTVSAPRWLRLSEIMATVAGKSTWIAERLDLIDEAGRLAGITETVRPQLLALPALAENWQVEYRQTPGVSAGVRTDQPGRILVHGAVGDNFSCEAALRSWLARRAKETLGPWLESLAAETGLSFCRLTIRNQRTRWGSCSAAGAISLNCKLLFLPPELVRYVLLHELCHTREHNHSGRYWSLLRQHEPDAAAMHRRMCDAWPRIPAWAHPLRHTDPFRHLQLLPLDG